MTTANLSALKLERQIQIPTEPGIWTDNDVDLGKLSDDLDVPDRALTAAELRSIPDVWAVALVFNEALLHHHPLHAEAVRRWRGLLALFGLQELYKNHYQLEVRQLELPSRNREVDRAVRARNPFTRVLSEMPPTERLPQTGGQVSGGEAITAEWDRLALIFIQASVGGSETAPLFGDAELVGICNPATLVAAGRTAEALSIPTAPWVRNGPDDPTALALKDRLGCRDYAVLGQYLKDLQDRLAILAAPDTRDPRYVAVSVALGAYRKAVDALSAGFDREIESGPAGHGGLPPLYEALLRAPRLGPHAYPVGYSHTALSLRPEFTSPANGGAENVGVFNGVILYDESLPVTLGRRPEDIHIWREHNLGSIKASGQLLERVRREAAQAGYLLVEPDDFFTREFVRLGQRNRDGADEITNVVMSHPSDSFFRTAVIPLSPLALMVLPPDKLLSALEVASSGKGRRAVTLRLAIQGNDAIHQITHIYEEQAGADASLMAERVGAPFGMISTWPNISRPKWRWNFLRLSNAVATRLLQARFGLSAASLARELSAETDPGGRAAKARTWFDSRTLAVEARDFSGNVTAAARIAPPMQRLRYRSDEIAEELQISAYPFEAVFLSRKRNPTDKEARPVGFVLLPTTPPNMADYDNLSTVVAVDFGTTNTVVSTDLDISAPVRLAARDRPADRDSPPGGRVYRPILDPTTEKANQDAFKWTFVDFMPIAAYELPIPTVAKRRRVQTLGDAALSAVAAGADDRPLFSDLIFFQPPLSDTIENSSSMDLKEFQSHQGSLLFNLKWGGDESAKQTSQRFLRQLMLQVSAELADRGRDPALVIWKFSYPEAMGEEEVGAFKEKIVSAWDDLFLKVQEAPPTRAASRIQDLTSEGTASARYFLNMENDQTSGPLLLVFDIGGATTDIAVLANGAQVWRNSFKLAGGDFLTHFLMNNPGYFSRIQLPDFADLRRDYAPNAWSTLYPTLGSGDQDLKGFGELLFSNDRFAKAMNENYSLAISTVEGRGLRHCAWIFLGGISYYMGLVMKELLVKGEFTRGSTRVYLTLDDVAKVTFALGGRGASLFKRYEKSATGGPSLLHRLFGLFISGAGLDPNDYPNRKILPSPRAKMEVVLGMLADNGSGSDDRLKEAPLSSFVPIGEQLEVRSADGTRVVAASVDSAEALAGGVQVRLPKKLAEFDRFLESLSELTGVQVDLKEASPEGAYDFITNKVNAATHDYTAALARSGAKDRPPKLEPVFITALRALLHLAGSPAEVRTRRLSIEDTG